MYGATGLAAPNAAQQLRSIADLEDEIRAREVQTGNDVFRLVVMTPVSLIRYSVSMVAGWLAVDGEVDSTRIGKMQKLMGMGVAWLEEV